MYGCSSFSTFTNDAEHLFICLFHYFHFILLCRNVCWDPWPIFKLGYLSFYCRVKCSLYILYTSPLSDTWFANILFHSENLIWGGMWFFFGNHRNINFFFFISNSLTVATFVMILYPKHISVCLQLKLK